MDSREALLAEPHEPPPGWVPVVSPGRQASRPVRLVMDVAAAEEDWKLPDENMPESNPHRNRVDLLKLLLLAFVARTRKPAMVAANLACRWNEQKPAVGVDPDIALIEPAPPDADHLTSLLTWRSGHVPPRFAIEVVSESNPYKDYDMAPAKYALLGTRELVVFDPEHRGATSNGGPFTLQVWRLGRTSEAEAQEPDVQMTRVFAGDGPAKSEELNAWLVVVGDKLRLADDPEGRSLWPTTEEAVARELLIDLCEAYGIVVNDARRAHLAGLNAEDLELFRRELKACRAWPA